MNKTVYRVLLIVALVLLAPKAVQAGSAGTQGEVVFYDDTHLPATSGTGQQPPIKYLSLPQTSEQSSAWPWLGSAMLASGSYWWWQRRRKDEGHEA